MKKKSILICLEKLDIGGVETSVVTQANEYRRRGYKVIVLAKKGIYAKKLEENGIKVYDYEFILDNYLRCENKIIQDIILKEKITEVHIHQYPCILHILPVIFKLKIPYVAFVHSIIDGTYEYFMQCHNVYKFALPLFFQMASKIVIIRPDEIEYNKKLFNISDNSRYYLSKNSIDFNEISIRERKTNQIEKFIIISRISSEKLKSIDVAIKYVKNLEKTNPNIRLSIIGDGPELESLKEKYSNMSIDYVGKTNDVYKYIQESDAVIGVDRCILEAISNKRLAIISSYDGNLCLVTPKNIDFLNKENFSGNNLKSEKKYTNFDINKVDYKKVVEENYQYVYKNHNIQKNIFDEKLGIMHLDDLSYIFDYSNYIIKDNEKWIEESKRLYLENQKLYKEIDVLNNKSIISIIADRIRSKR